MAVIIGEFHPITESLPLHVRPTRWLVSRLRTLLSTRRNPSPYPDRIWRRHSALLDAAWKCRGERCQRRG